MPRLEKISSKGCWIMVRQLIPVAIPIDPLSVYYAMPIKKTLQNDFFVPEDYYEDGALKNYHKEMWASIKTEYGEVVLKEHEYTIIQDQSLAEYFEALTEHHAEIHFFGKTNAGGNKLNETVFYIRSRGISMAKAMELSIGMVKSQNVFYITMHQEYQRIFTRYYDQYLTKKTNFLKNQPA